MALSKYEQFRKEYRHISVEIIDQFEMINCIPNMEIRDQFLQEHDGWVGEINQILARIRPYYFTSTGEILVDKTWKRPKL